MVNLQNLSQNQLRLGDNPTNPIPRVINKSGKELNIPPNL